MEISGISKISSSADAWAEAKALSQPPASSLSTASAAVSSSDKTPNTVLSVPVITPVATQSTTVAGKSYSESVMKLGDDYVVSVPNPPGASAVGSSVESAESQLSMKLDTLV